MCIAAERTDVLFEFPRINIPEVEPHDDLQISSAHILFSPDSVAQDGNETFVLTFTIPQGLLGFNPTLRRVFSGVVVDATRNTYKNISASC